MNRYYDLTHLVDQNTYHPFGGAYFRNVQAFSSHGCRHAYITMSLHFGTHMDAPWHMVADGKRLDEIDIRELIGEAIIVDLSNLYGPTKKSGSPISRKDLESALVKQGHQLRPRDAIIIYTGWMELFQADPIRYFRSYCTLGQDASEWLVHQGVRLIGLDVSDIDLPSAYETAPFHPTNHRLVLGAGIYVIENVGGELPNLVGKRVMLIPAPFRLGGEYASGAPIRLLAQEISST
jgi:kynurenine formamidase